MDLIHYAGHALRFRLGGTLTSVVVLLDSLMANNNNNGPSYYYCSNNTTHIVTTTGPVSSIMVNKFGCRPVMLLGGLLASAGMISASFTTNIIQLYMTAGVLTGLSYEILLLLSFYMHLLKGFILVSDHSFLLYFSGLIFSWVKQILSTT